MSHNCFRKPRNQSALALTLASTVIALSLLSTPIQASAASPLEATGRVPASPVTTLLDAAEIPETFLPMPVSATVKATWISDQLMQTDRAIFEIDRYSGRWMGAVFFSMTLLAAAMKCGIRRRAMAGTGRGRAARMTGS